MFDNFKRENLLDMDQLKDIISKLSREERREKKNNKKWLIVSMVALVGIGAGIFAWFKFFKEDEYDLDEYDDFDDDFDDEFDEDFEEDYYTTDDDDEDGCDCGDDCTCSDDGECGCSDNQEVSEAKPEEEIKF